MSNHPNRNKENQITPEMVRALRCDLTQEEAANLWRTNRRTVQRWESGEIRPSYIAWRGMQVVIEEYNQFKAEIKTKIESALVNADQKLTEENVKEILMQVIIKESKC